MSFIRVHTSIQHRCESGLSLGVLVNAILSVFTEYPRSVFPRRLGWRRRFSTYYGLSFGVGLDYDGFGPAAFCSGERRRPNREPPSMWPSTWIKKWWKPKSYRQDLVRSGALIAAEIDRWDRALIDQPAPAPQTVQEAAKVLLDAGKLPEEAVLVAHNQIDWHRGEQNTFSPTHRTQTHMGGTSCAKDIQDAWKEALRAISDTPAPLSPKG